MFAQQKRISTINYPGTAVDYSFVQIVFKPNQFCETSIKWIKIFFTKYKTTGCVAA